MKVQVTKDAFGVTVWKSGVDLVFAASLHSVGSMHDPAVWMPKVWHPFSKPQLFSRAVVKECFPDLAKDWPNGKLNEMELSIS